MKILAIEKSPPGPQEITNDDYAPHLKAEAFQVWKLYQSAIIREMYFTDTPVISALQDNSPGIEQEDAGHSAVLILECSDVFEAREVLNTLPLVKEKLIDFEIIPLIPYPGFERLFETYT